MKEQYLIWSNEHRAWWAPPGAGYTTLTHAAGRYSKDQARGIDISSEVMVLAPTQYWSDKQFINAALLSVMKKQTSVGKSCL